MLISWRTSGRRVTMPEPRGRKSLPTRRCQTRRDTESAFGKHGSVTYVFQDGRLSRGLGADNDDLREVECLCAESVVCKILMHVSMGIQGSCLASTWRAAGVLLVSTRRGEIYC